VVLVVGGVLSAVVSLSLSFDSRSGRAAAGRLLQGGLSSRRRGGH
jgi:hypothetical protein